MIRFRVIELEIIGLYWIKNKLARNSQIRNDRLRFDRTRNDIDKKVSKYY